MFQYGHIDVREKGPISDVRSAKVEVLESRRPRPDLHSANSAMQSTKETKHGLMLLCSVRTCALFQLL